MGRKILYSSIDCTIIYLGADVLIFICEHNGLVNFVIYIAEWFIYYCVSVVRIGSGSIERRCQLVTVSKLEARVNFYEEARAS